MKSYLIFGLGTSGISSLNLLLNKKDKFYLYDDSKENREEIYQKYSSYKNVFGIEILDDTILDMMDTIILSPSISINDDRLKKAKKMGKEVISELELGFRHAKSKIIAITGTNGKTTTTSLIYNILSTAHKKCAVAGNIGYPLSSAVRDIRGGYIVTEVSSFQLEGVKNFKPYIACLLNITPDHLDRHGSMKTYCDLKYSIFKNMTKHSFAILNDNLPEIKNFHGKRLKFSHKSQKNCVFNENGKIYLSLGNKKEYIMPATCIKLKGEYNLENVLCAILVAKLCHVKNKYIISAIENFQPDKHRLEKVYEVDGNIFYDDSKATNVDATFKAVQTLYQAGKIRLIMGGSDKGENYDFLCSQLSQKVSHVYITGDNKHKIATSFDGCGFKNYTMCINFNDAVTKALNDLNSGDILLLSPASASFDEFSSYKQRGDKFLEIIKHYYEK